MIEINSTNGAGELITVVQSGDLVTTRPGHVDRGGTVQSITVTAVAEVVANLLDRIAEIEHPDDGWPGADTVDALTGWLADLGLNAEQSAAQMARDVRDAAGIPYVP